MNRGGDIHNGITGGHWHGGPDPCPVCGGLAPHLRPRPPRKTRPPIELLPPLAIEVEDE